MGKSSINGPFSMAMLNNQRVYIYIYMSYDVILYIVLFPQTISTNIVTYSYINDSCIVS